jgi:hypothetical protein
MKQWEVNIEHDVYIKSFSKQRIRSGLVTSVDARVDRHRARFESYRNMAGWRSFVARPFASN